MIRELLRALLKTKDPRSRFLPKALVCAAALHALIAIAAVSAAPFWPDPFTASMQARLPGVIDAFAHTPRVEAMLDRETAAGHPDQSREERRLGHAVSDLIVALSLAAILMGFTVILLWGIREPSYSARIRGLARPEADPILSVVIFGVCATFAVGAGSMLYFSVMSDGNDRASGIFLVFMDLMLLCMLAILAALLHRVLVRQTA
jgi:hypothetical protein